MELIKLRDKDINEFKKLMQESFQYGYESVYGGDKEQVLPDKDIDENLKDLKDNKKPIYMGFFICMFLYNQDLMYQYYYKFYYLIKWFYCYYN